MSLTDRQAACLAVITAYLAKHGFPPAQREIRDALGVASLRSVQGYLERLEAAGQVVYHRGVARGLTVPARPRRRQTR